MKIEKRSRGRPKKTLNDVFIEDVEQRLNQRGLTIDCRRRLAENQHG